MAVSPPEITTSRALGAQEIFRAKAPPPLRVEVPELGGHLFVRVLPAGERDAMESAIRRAVEAGDPSIHARVVCVCACDEAGKRLFEDGAEQELAEMEDGRVIVRIADAAGEHNQLSPRAREQAAKNS